MPRWVVAEGDAAESSSEEEEEEQEDVDDAEDEEQEQDGAAAKSAGRSKIKVSLKQKNSDVCHVCGKSGHSAGFIGGGSVYLDCPNKPCYLCKQPGHTTATCPHRIAPEHGCVQAASAAEQSMLGSVIQRERDGRRRETAIPEQHWQVEAAVLKLHSRRCTCLEFHPTRDDIVLSGDKKGQVAIWNFEKVCERTVYKIHQALTNNIRFLPGNDDMCCTASSDGLVKVFDLELGESSAKVKLNLNPGGYIPNVTKEKDWGMLHGMDVNRQANFILVGDTRGRVNCIDPRASKPFAQPQLHKKDKVVSVQVNPADSNLVLTASNDHTARISDMRCLSNSLASSSDGGSSAADDDPAQLACMDHPKVVNSAFFSPRTGTKILTTCIDNRLRVWDNLYGANGPPDREIVHSHDFNRYLTPFRAEWDYKDPFERVTVVGRYISEDFDGVALHPIDLYDVSSGRLLCQLTDANLTTICPVNKPHPRQEIIISGSSRSLYAWTPRPADEEVEREKAAAAEKRREGTGPFRLDGAGGYLFFDADDAATEKKKRRASGEAGPSKGKKK